MLLAAAAAQAEGTDTNAGTVILNQATVDYTVGGINQPDLPSNVTTFVTDRKINLTVAESGGLYTDVAPGMVEQVLTFTVTNLTNAPLDFLLSATQDATGASDPFGNTDDFDIATFSIFVDADDNGTYDVGTDTESFLDEIAEDDSVAVFIVSTIPSGQANGDTAGFTLTATAAEPGLAGTAGGPAAETGTEDPDVIDTVFADVLHETDAAGNGQDSDDDAYRIETATLIVTKTVEGGERSVQPHDGPEADPRCGDRVLRHGRERRRRAGHCGRGHRRAAPAARHVRHRDARLDG